MPGCRAVAWRPSISQDDAEHDLECRKPKAVGEPYEGKPHVRFEVAGGRNQECSPRRHSLTLPADALERAAHAWRSLGLKNVGQTTCDVHSVPSECSARRCREQERVPEGHLQ